MKNEKLVLAISDIADDLIEEAHGDMLCRRPGKRAAVAVAACFAALLASVFVWRSIRSIDVFVFGNNIAEKRVVSLSEDEPSSLFRAHEQGVSEHGIPLVIEACGECAVSVSGGNIVYTDRKSGETASGAVATVSGNTEIIWSVDLGDKSSVYEMTIKKSSGELTLTLIYDSESKNWQIVANDK